MKILQAKLARCNIREVCSWDAAHASYGKQDLTAVRAEAHFVPSWSATSLRVAPNLDYKDVTTTVLPIVENLSSALCTLFTHRELIQRPDSSVSLLEELRLERASQRPIVLGKLRYIKKDVEWDLRKLFGTRVDVRFVVLVGRKSV